MKPKLFFPILLALGAGLPHLTFAEAMDSTGEADSDPSSSTTMLDTVTVMGTRTETLVQNSPVSVSIIERDSIDRQVPESVVELLRDLPGVTIVDTSAAGMQRVRIRGESSRRITIMIDGQEVTDHSTNGTPLLIDPASVERVEVVRGAASVLYGSKAIGGVINIVTRRGASKPVQFEAGGTAYSGSDGWQGWSAVSGTQGDFDYRLSGSMNRHKDRRIADGPWSDARGRLERTAYHNGDAALHLGYRFGEQRNHYLSFKTNKHWLTTEAWTDPDSFEYPVTDFFLDLPLRDLTKSGLYYDATDLGPVVRKVHVDMYHQKVDRLFANRVAMQPTPMIDVVVRSTSDDRNVNWGGTAQIDLQLHPAHYTIAGLYYLNDDLDTLKTTDVTSKIGPRPPETEHESRRDQASARTVSVFVQDEWSLPHDFKLTAGMRYYRFRAGLDESSETIRPDQKGRSASSTIKSVGLVWNPTEGTTWRALYSEGYIMPTLLEMFTDNSAGRGELTYGNPALASERSRNIELGMRWHAGGWMLDADTYYTRATDYITTQGCDRTTLCPSTAVPGTLIYVNADGATTYGVELLAEYQPRDSLLAPYASLGWGRRKLKFPNLPRNDGAVSGYDRSMPEITGRLGVRLETAIPNAGIWADAFLRGATSSGQSPVTEAQHLLVSETADLGGWVTANLAVGASFGGHDQYRLSLQLNNMLDRSYRTSVDELPALGRNAVASFQLAF